VDKTRRTKVKYFSDKDYRRDRWNKKTNFKRRKKNYNFGKDPLKIKKQEEDIDIDDATIEKIESDDFNLDKGL
jgi:hypothetical protein